MTDTTRSLNECRNKMRVAGHYTDYAIEQYPDMVKTALLDTANEILKIMGDASTRKDEECLIRDYLHEKERPEPVSGRGASCDDPRTIKVSETMALTPPDGVNPRTPSLPPEQPDECPKCKTAFVAGLAAGRPNDYAKLEAELATLQRFKDYVHKRLDEAGIPTHPEGEHSKHGCRIGDRLDIALRSPMRESGN